jgi:hypothetical protein
VDYQPDGDTTLRPLTAFEALVELQQSGFWVEHKNESIAGFLSWLGRIGRHKLTYSRIDEATQTVAAILAP